MEFFDLQQHNNMFTIIHLCDEFFSYSVDIISFHLICYSVLLKILSP